MGTGLIMTIAFSIVLSAGNAILQDSSIFPYYKVNHVNRSNGIYLADGIVVEEKEKWDAMNNKIETLFYLKSTDDSTWQWIKPRGITVRNNLDTLKYEAFPRNIVAFKDHFISIIDVGENPDRMQVIHYSKDGILWISTGIYVTSIHVIKDKIIAEHNLSLAVSDDGVNWNLFAYNNWDNSYPEYTNTVSTENQTIHVFSYTDTTGEFNKEEYPFVTYDWEKLKGYFRDSTYVLTDTSSFIAISNDSYKWRYVETPTKADSNLCLQYAHGRIIYIEISKGSYYLNSTTDFINWKKTKIETDSSDFENGFFIENAFIPDTTLFLEVSAFYGNEENGIHEYKVYLTSEDGTNFSRCDLNAEVNYGLPNASQSTPISRSLSVINFQFKDLIDGQFRVNDTN